MSLLVWLPLKGNLRQQGLSNLTFINNSANITTINSGKIGRCYQRATKQTAGRISSDKTVNLNEDITMCCWAMVTDAVTSTGYAHGILTNHSHANNTGLGITAKIISDTDYRISCSTGNGSARTWDTYYGTTNIKNTWHHLALTYSKSNKQLLLYVDGNIEYTLNNYNNASRDDYIMLFEWSTTYDNSAHRCAVKLNDVRIYDECLSQKQVKEISKCLVAHFKLDNLSIYNENLFSVFQAGGRTTLSNGIIKTTGENGDTYFYINTKKALESGKQYILELCCDGLNPGVTWSFCLGSQSSSSATYAGEMFIHQGITKFNFTCPEGLNGATRFIMDDLSRAAGAPVIKISNCRLMEYSAAYFLDTSGYGYAVAAVDFNLKYILNTPRYSSAISRDTATKPIGRISSGLFLINQTINELTLCGWWKTTAANTNTKNLISLNGNSFIRFGPSSATTLWIYCYFADNNTRYLEATIPYSITDNNWHFYATTFKDGVIKAYVDGNLIGTKDCSADSTQLLCKGTTNYLGGYNASQELVPGSFSDYRIYVTALSADDIKQLYTTCTFIDDKNNLLTCELSEV